MSSEGWNHLGDLSFDAAGGPRLLVPLECYYPTASDPNTCHTGGFGVVDPVTLQWRYYVKLDPAQITKAMWVEVSPDGRWAWTSSGTDLLAYDATQISTQRAGPTGTPLTAAKRIVGVLRAPGVSGAAFLGDRLYLAFDRGSYVQVLSYPVNPTTGDGERRGGWRSTHEDLVALRDRGTRRGRCARRHASLADPAPDPLLRQDRALRARKLTTAPRRPSRRPDRRRSMAGFRVVPADLLCASSSTRARVTADRPTRHCGARTAALVVL